MTTEPDDDDRAARRRASGASAADRRGTLLVEAAAGTGKTTVLLDRVLAHLEAGEQRLGQIAVVTFTEAAAAELRERLAQRLEPSGGRPPQWATHALAELETATIGTLHAFCAELLRARPQVAGVAPGFSITAPFERRLRMQQAWEELLRHEPPAAEILDAAADLGLEDEAALRAAAFSLFDLGAAELPQPVADGLLAAGERLLEVDRLLAEAADRAHGALVGVVREARAALARLLGQPLEQALSELVRRGPPVAIVGGRAGFAARRGARQLLATARQRLAALAADLVHQRLSRLAAWLAKGGERYAAQLARDGVLDFDQLVRRAVALLADPAARRAAQRRYPVVLVDEFQDTDAEQCELLHRLATPVGRGSGLRSLVLVGDPKQSIYRFRGADLESYHRLREQLVDPRQRVRLSRSFRPLPRLAEWINRALGEIMANASAPWEAPYARLVAERPHATPELGGVIVCELAVAPRAGAAAIRAAEATALAAAARRLIAAPGSEVRSRSGALRPATWRDVALLLPRLTAVEPYRRALQAAGVPHRILGASGTTQRPEVAALLSLLRAVADPGDPVATVAALRGLPFACSDRSLAALTLAGARLDLTSIGGEAPAAGPDAAAAADAWAACRRLRELARRAAGRSLPEAVSLLLEESGLMLHCARRDPSGEQAAVLDRIRLLAERVEPIAGPSLSGASRALAVILEEGEGGAIELASDLDAVAISTVHGAKGLEFPVVLLGGLADGPAGAPGLRVLRRPRGGVALALTRRLASHGAAAAIARESERAAAEAKRLLYVAVTRARDTLVVPHLAGHRPRSPLFGPLSACGALAVGVPEVVARWTAAAAPAAAPAAPPRPSPAPPVLADLTASSWPAVREPSLGEWSADAPATLRRVVEAAPGGAGRSAEERRLGRLLATPLGQRARAARRRWVGCWIAAPGGGSSLVAAIDLAFREGRGWVVIALASACEGEMPQRLRAASAAIEAALGEPVLEAVVWDRSQRSRRYPAAAPSASCPKSAGLSAGPSRR